MEIWIPLIVCVITTVGNIIISRVQHNKTITIIEYRLQQLEQAQNKHNSVIERTYALEKDVAILKEVTKPYDKN